MDRGGYCFFEYRCCESLCICAHGAGAALMGVGLLHSLNTH